MFPSYLEAAPAAENLKRRNAAAWTSMIAAMLWLVCLVVPIAIIATTHSNLLPDWLATITALGLLSLPIVGIIAGHIGLRHANRQPDLRSSRPLALTGLLLSYLWVIGVFFISDLGAAVEVWVTHLGR